MAANGEELTEGPLSKWTNKLSGWQYRWFVLDSKGGCMSYYTSREKLKKGSAKGVIQLKNAKLVMDKDDEYSFTINSEGKKYTFQAHDVKQREKWARAIRSVSGHSNNTELISEPAGEGEESSITSKLVSQLKTTVPDPEQNDVDDDDDFFDALPVIVTPDSPQVSSSPESSLGKDSVGSRDSPVRQTAKPHGPYLDVNHAFTPSGATLGPSGDPAVRRATSSLALEKTSGSRHWRRTSVLSDGASMKEEGEVKVQVNIAEVKSQRQAPDVLDDSYFEEDDLAGSLQAHKNIVLHILGQLKPGVDLTRISLPAFILEKRSNLEMIADMFAYTDLYACIPTYPDPKERLTAVVRFCVSTFPAGRKGANVKKPYNPVLGEVFKCYYELPEVMQVDREMDQTRTDLVASGPIPWASYSSACYIAEQVSHHPPVSAFYAECPATGVCVLGSLQTKPKFMGLSVSIVNTGTVYITIPKLGEVYSMNIPNAYGRSILTQPWMEIGGKMNVSCEQTGCHAVVEFHCKPIYGGRKHRVTGELFGPCEKKPFLKLEGEWLNVIYSKKPSGETQEFFRAKDPQYKKKVKVLESMEPYESRRVWQHVTEALKQGQESLAADAKHEVEEKQREAAKTRKDAGIEWRQKYFHQLDNGEWVYNDVIEDRWARLGIH